MGDYYRTDDDTVYERYLPKDAEGYCVGCYFYDSGMAYRHGCPTRSLGLPSCIKRGNASVTYMQYRRVDPLYLDLLKVKEACNERQKKRVQRRANLPGSRRGVL